MKAELTIRVVAFIDILGFSEIIKRISGEAEPELFKLIDLTFSEIERRRNKIDSSNQQPEKMTAFSDCFVISTIPERYDYLIDLIALMTRRLLINGILLRGGITMGKLFHDSDRVFGEGLISAYNLENKAAVYPRILIDLPEEMQWSPNFSLLNTPCKYNVFGYKSGNVNGSKIREDSDGGCIINIFSPYFSCRLGPSKGYMLRVTECS